jgi:hypothetical protein
MRREALSDIIKLLLQLAYLELSIFRNFSEAGRADWRHQRILYMISRRPACSASPHESAAAGYKRLEIRRDRDRERRDPHLLKRDR